MRFTGYDANDIARVYGEHKNADAAESMCREQAIAYVRGRPDTGPLSKWIFKAMTTEPIQCGLRAPRRNR